MCGTVANQASRIIKKVLKATTYMEATGSNDTAELKAKVFSVRINVPKIHGVIAKSKLEKTNL